MSRLSTIAPILVVLLTFFLPAAQAQTPEVDAAKERILERNEDIESLWNRGLIGENNKGLISARSSISSKNERMIEAENKDRKILYKYVAEKTDTTPEYVGKQRAAQIAKGASVGLWLQNEKGEWYRK